jgi:hypothetical protein
MRNGMTVKGDVDFASLGKNSHHVKNVTKLEKFNRTIFH